VSLMLSVKEELCVTNFYLYVFVISAVKLCVIVSLLSWDCSERWLM